MTTVRWCATYPPQGAVPGITFNPRGVCLSAKELPEPQHPAGDLAAEYQWHASTLPDLAKDITARQAQFTTRYLQRRDS